MNTIICVIQTTIEFYLGTKHISFMTEHEKEFYRAKKLMATNLALILRSGESFLTKQICK